MFDKFPGDDEETKPGPFIWIWKTRGLHCICPHGSSLYVKRKHSFLEQLGIHTGRLLVCTFMALSFNLFTMLSICNQPFASVSEAANTRWQWEHVAVLIWSLCRILLGLSSIFAPWMHPLALTDLVGASALCTTYMLIEMNNYFALDTASATAIALMTFGTLCPWVCTVAECPTRLHPVLLVSWTNVPEKDVPWKEF